MSEPKPVFARIETERDSESGVAATKKVGKRKEKSPQAQKPVEA
ncbi:hypothetical protein OFM39_27970 [Escherichia coli]|nr:hypothetical protein [Escherichia coli]